MPAANVMEDHGHNPPETGSAGEEAPAAVASVAEAVAEVTEWTEEALLKALDKNFGFSAFRPGQDEVIQSVLAGEHAVVVMPTGSGKSLCYQLPGILLPGLTLVVSPLIALMQDQVESLQALGLPAACINSTVGWEAQMAAMDDARRGRLKILFVTPERFHVASFQRALQDMTVSLLAVDEAHCISEWGHDFRPDYRRLREVRQALGDPCTIALTATATPAVRKDIVKQLGLGDCEPFVFGFERENLLLRVEKVGGKKDKLEEMAKVALGHGGSGIIYCATRRQTEEVALGLSKMGVKSAAYHAGLRDDRRSRIQAGFMNDDFDCLVATMAFGMGVDKPDVRYVIHYNLPGSLESYYQEAGRAGRDGKPAECVLLYNYADTRVHDFFIKNSYPPKRVIYGVWKKLLKMGKPGQLLRVDTDRIADRLPGKVHGMAVSTTMKLLKRAGHVEWVPNPRGWIVKEVVKSHKLKIDHKSLARQADLDRDRLKKVVFYATGEKCRTHDILNYFGSREAQRDGHCNHCDKCGAMPTRSGGGSKATTQTVKAVVSQQTGGRAPRRRSKTRRLPCVEPPRTVLRKVLSCIVRLESSATATNIKRVLCGSSASRMEEEGFNELSTWRLLDYMSQADVKALLDVLEEHEAVQSVARRYVLTELGQRLMVDPDAGIPQSLGGYLDRMFPKAPQSAHPYRPS